MTNHTDNLYERAGISDLGEFYRTKFISDEVLNARYFKALDRFDIRFARTMWIFDNVHRGSSLLDLGCGAGMLALLKTKDVTLTGVDLSAECASAARSNGYDFTATTELSKLPFPDDSFDYVVSLDVLGHIGFDEKDAVIAEIKRVLKPNGVTMHGIECTDHAAQRNYEEMSPEELRRFIEVDGHVGLEEEQEHGKRFLKFFKYVAWEPRYALCLSSEEFLKQADRYGIEFETDFLDYLRGLSFKERRAFDMAMGYVFGKISDLNLSLPKAGLYVFLKASNVPLGRFYNEHRDRTSLYPTHQRLKDDGCLDRNAATAFDDGWYEPNFLPPIARWMNTDGKIRFDAKQLSEISLDLTTHMPDVHERALLVEFFVNGQLVNSLNIIRKGWLHANLLVPRAIIAQADGKFELHIRAGRTWKPRPTNDETRDDREISIAVCNIEVRSQESRAGQLQHTTDTWAIQPTPDPRPLTHDP